MGVGPGSSSSSILFASTSSSAARSSSIDRSAQFRAPLAKVASVCCAYPVAFKEIVGCEVGGEGRSGQFTFSDQFVEIRERPKPRIDRINMIRALVVALERYVARKIDHQCFTVSRAAAAGVAPSEPVSRPA